MNGKNDLDAVLWHKAAFMVVGMLVVGYVALAIKFPVLWAVLTSVFFVLATGLLTTRVVLRFHNGMVMWLLTFAFGLAWLLFFYLLWMLKGLVE
ncbi:MAG: hypothetical protein ABR915_23200 [Thermoguttaceae bacterium]|jgi:hypothetical protein